MSLPADFAFTQGSLQDYADCPRRFQLRHIQRMRYPAIEADPALEYEKRIRRGARFHQLVQQHLLGTPSAVLASSLHDDETLAAWWRVFMRVGLKDLPPLRYTEITLQTRLSGRRLLAKFDLLALQPDERAIIIDWKTGGLPPRQRLENRMQTLLYRYILARAGEHLYGAPIPPEKITMIYVFVARDGQRVALDYSAAQLQTDEARLSQLIQSIESAREFPLTQDDWHCQFCVYRSLCDRGEAGQVALLDKAEDDREEEDFTLDFDQIAEIAF